MKDHPVERKRQEQIIKNRDNAQVTEALEDVREACQKGINIMPSLFKAARAMAWEVVDIFREVWGIWQPILPQRHRGHGVAHEAMSVFSVSL